MPSYPSSHPAVPIEGGSRNLGLGPATLVQPSPVTASSWQVAELSREVTCPKFTFSPELHCFLTGSRPSLATALRADFGIMKSDLLSLPQDHGGLSLCLLGS